MKILMHICCAPCAVYPVARLRANSMQVSGFFFNHNIHPYLEYRRRLDTVVEYAQKQSLDTVVEYAQKQSLEVIIADEYRLEEFLAAVAGKTDERCLYCYGSRLERTAEAAAERGFDCFTSSLLYSRYQKHDIIRSLGERAGQKYGVSFHYDDYRRGWQEGIRLSKGAGMYRQQYCGCIYSEKERYAPKISSRKQ